MHCITIPPHIRPAAMAGCSGKGCQPGVPFSSSILITTNSVSNNDTNSIIIIIITVHNDISIRCPLLGHLRARLLRPRRALVAY